jgi:hypothetical protein
VAGSKNFGDGLVITAYRTSAGSDVAQFRISRTGDLSASQVISYVSSSIDSLLEPGRHYKAVGGVLRFDAGVADRLINVPLDPEALALLGSGTISLEVAELDDLGQKDLHLLFDVDPTDQGLRPVLSGLKLEVDGSGNLAAIGFRADTTNPAIDEGLASTLNFKVLRRPSADSSASDPGTRSQQLVISEGALAKYDQDGSDNEQVELEFLLNASSGSIQLQPVNSQLSSLVLSKLDPAKKAITLGIELTTKSLDSLRVNNRPDGKVVELNKTVVDFDVMADDTGKAKVYLDLTQVADDLLIAEVVNGVPTRVKDKYLVYYGLDNEGNLTPLTYSHRTGEGARFYDTDGDRIADRVSLVFRDGGLGDTGIPGDGVINDPSTAGVANLKDIVLSANEADPSILLVADKGNTQAPASLRLRATLKGKAVTSNQLYFVVADPAEFKLIFDDFSLLKERSSSLMRTVESSDYMLPSDTSLISEILLVNGQSFRIFEVLDGSLSDLTSSNDPRLRIFGSSGFSPDSRSINVSSPSGVSLLLTLVNDGDQGLADLFAQVQTTAPLLDLTNFTADQIIEGTVSLAREASLNSKTSFYRCLDALGTVWRDSSNQSLGTITPGQAGTSATEYGAAALKNVVDALTGMTVGNHQTNKREFDLAGGGYLAPIAEVSGNIYVGFAAGNVDGHAHFQMLSTNTFGLEDLRGLGDRDFDDQILSFAFTKVNNAIV